MSRIGSWFDTKTLDAADYLDAAKLYRWVLPTGSSTYILKKIDDPTFLEQRGGGGSLPIYAMSDPPPFASFPADYFAAAAQLAINAAPSLGCTSVRMNASMLPYNASLVTFNNAVRMLREGGPLEYWDVRAYGANGNGTITNDDTAAFTAAISAAANATAGQFTAGNTVYIPAGGYILTGTVQLPIAINQNAVTLRGAQMRSTILYFKGATTNFTAAPTTPALVLVGTQAPEAAGTFNSITQYSGVENITIDGGNLTGTGSVRGLQYTEAISCWGINIIIQNLPNSSTGLYLRGSTVTGGLGVTPRPEVRECFFIGIDVQPTVGSGATSTPSALILQNADENNFYDCKWAVTPGLTGTGADSIFCVWYQMARQNRMFGTLVSGDTTANKTQYVGHVFGPPVNESGAANGEVYQNQTYGDWIEGFDRCLWNRADSSGNTNGNMIWNLKAAIYNTVFLDDNDIFRVGPGGFLSFIVFAPGLGTPDGPINYFGGTRGPYSQPIIWAANNATPDVSGSNFFITANSSPTTITNFLNPKPGQWWVVSCQDANTTIAANSNITLLGGTSVNLANGSVMVFAYDGRSTFNKYQIAGSVSRQIGSYVEPTDQATVAINAAAGFQRCVLTASRTIGAPSNDPSTGNSQYLTIQIFNNSGGAITTSWNGIYLLAGGAWTDPANGKSRCITFFKNNAQAKWVEISRSSADT